MEIKSVAILGAGAIGAYFLFGLTELNDIDLCLVAEGERKARLERDGIIINDRHYHPAVKTPAEARGVDLLLISTKYQGLLDALDDIRAIAAPGTTVLSLLNGIDSEEILGTVIDPAQIPYSLMRISSARDGNRIRFDAEQTLGLYIGVPGQREEDERLLPIRALIERAGLGYHFCPDIIAEQWQKFTSNIAYNLPQAILGVGYGAYFDSEHVAYLRDRLEEEVRTVAAAYGISYPRLGTMRALSTPDARFSTLQDLDNGRHTEVGMFCGVLMEKAAAKDIAVPFAEYTYHAIRALEEKNGGRFRYGD